MAGAAVLQVLVGEVCNPSPHAPPPSRDYLACPPVHWLSIKTCTISGTLLQAGLQKSKFTNVTVANFKCTVFCLLVYCVQYHYFRGAYFPKRYFFVHGCFKAFLADHTCSFKYIDNIKGSIQLVHKPTGPQLIKSPLRKPTDAMVHFVHLFVYIVSSEMVKTSNIHLLNPTPRRTTIMDWLICGSIDVLPTYYSFL